MIVKRQNPAVKYRYLWPIIPLVLISVFGALSGLPALQTNTCASTADEVIKSYETGSFRTIHTGTVRPDGMVVSPNGTHVLVYGDGLYRLTDGAFFEFNIGPFSPDGLYLAQIGRGIYRLSDFQQVLPARSESIVVGHDGHIIPTGVISFSPNGVYAAISGAGYYRQFADSSSAEGYGVFRLSDGQQVVESDSFSITFSFDSAYIAVQEGIFRLSDGEKLFDFARPADLTAPIFHSDGYVYFGYDAVFHLNDRQPLFDTHFSPDNLHVVLPDDGGYGDVYRLSDNQLLYSLNHPRVSEYLLMFSSSGHYMAVPSDKIFVYRVADGALLFEINYDSYSFSPTDDLIAISGDGVYRLSDQQQLFSISNWGQFSPEGAYFVSAYDGVYRLNDATKLFDIENPHYALPVFSPDGMYVVFRDGGLYNLNTQQKVFDIKGSAVGFTPDSAYITSFHGGPTIYRVRDGRYFENLEFLNIPCGILRTENAVLIVDPVE